MDRLGWARVGLWTFTAGIFAWIFPNASAGNTVNVLTDVVIVAAGILTAIGLPRAVDGIGNGLFRWGLVGVAVGQFGQNLNTAATGFGAVTAAPVIVVMLASVAVVIGARRWQEDDWDLAATPWLMGGFAGFAFEPVYYFIVGLVQGNPLGPYFPGAVLVGAGAILAALAFRPGGSSLPEAKPVAVPAKPSAAKVSKAAKPATPAKGRKPRAGAQS